MTSVADALLAAGLIPQMETVHGESIVMLSGDDAGKTFTGIISLEQDMVFSGDIGEDRRAKRTVSFLGSYPYITGHAMLQDASGRRWKAIRMPGDTYLSKEYELVSISAQDT